MVPAQRHIGGRGEGDQPIVALDRIIGTAPSIAPAVILTRIDDQPIVAAQPSDSALAGTVERRPRRQPEADGARARKGGVTGKRGAARVDLGGCRLLKKKQSSPPKDYQ